MRDKDLIQKKYDLVKEEYKSFGVDVEAVLEALNKTSVSLHCWQGDDVRGLEDNGGALTGGIMSTGNYPGIARNVSELRMDLDKAMSLIPGKQKLNLHAMYPDFDGKLPDRDKITVEHFQGWIDWAKEKNYKLDFKIDSVKRINKSNQSAHPPPRPPFRRP